jgi:glycine cleavage system H protein
MQTERIHYRRSRFATSLPGDRRYTAGHYWLLRDEGAGSDRWRIGLTKFATRMLGDPVELDFEIEPGAPIETGQVIGWLEGFKATTDIYAPLPGAFAGINPDLESEIALINTDPYGRGWLFEVCGHPGEDGLDVHGYVSVLDATIDRMLGKHHESP